MVFSFQMMLMLKVEAFECLKQSELTRCFFWCGSFGGLDHPAGVGSHCCAATSLVERGAFSVGTAWLHSSGTAKTAKELDLPGHKPVTS